MDPKLQDKLLKVLALTTSPEEGEAAAAAAMLQRLLEAHNLQIADLEKKGAEKPGIRESGHDLGKAAFTWKLNLAEGIARHFYCAPLVDRSRKTVAFVGRPDNVDTLKGLYTWLIGQVREISATERRAHQESTGEHVDPLRWQVNFGVGAVSRLVERIGELKRKREQDDAAAAGNALVLSLSSEVSDYLERTRGYREDGQPTARERQWQEEDARLAKLKETDLEAYYRERPWDRPQTEEEKQRRLEAARKADREWEAKERRRERARVRSGYYDRQEERASARYNNPEEVRKRTQARRANNAGHSAAERVNLEPFLTGRKPNGGSLK